MRNITVAIHDQTYHDVRVWCAKRDTSISAVVQWFLEDLPQLKQARRFPLPGAPTPKILVPLMATTEPDPPPVPPPNLQCNECSRSLRVLGDAVKEAKTGPS